MDSFTIDYSTTSWSTGDQWEALPGLFELEMAGYGYVPDLSSIQPLANTTNRTPPVSPVKPQLKPVDTCTAIQSRLDAAAERSFKTFKAVVHYVIQDGNIEQTENAIYRHLAGPARKLCIKCRVLAESRLVSVSSNRPSPEHDVALVHPLPKKLIGNKRAAFCQTARGALQEAADAGAASRQDLLEKAEFLLREKGVECKPGTMTNHVHKTSDLCNRLLKSLVKEIKQRPKTQLPSQNVQNCSKIAETIPTITSLKAPSIPAVGNAVHAQLTLMKIPCASRESLVRHLQGYRKKCSCHQITVKHIADLKHQQSEASKAQ